MALVVGRVPAAAARWAGPSALVLWLVGCPAPPPPEEAPPPEGVLHPPSELGPDFTLDHRVVIRWHGREEGFRGVLDKLGDVLTLVGLGPHGGRGFVLRQEGLEVSFESQLPEALPFPPEHILMTLHRAWLLGLSGPLPDGEHRAERDGEEIVERWAGDRVVSRTFRVLDGSPSGLFEVTYDGGFDPTLSSAPSRVLVVDAWLGYQLEATAITLTRL